MPKFAQKNFWDEPPPNVAEFWAFRSRPDCKKGDLLEFYFGAKKVAEAKVAMIEAKIAMIEAKGCSKCEHSGKFLNHWKVFWLSESFKDLRE